MTNIAFSLLIALSVIATIAVVFVEQYQIILLIVAACSLLVAVAVNATRARKRTQIYEALRAIANGMPPAQRPVGQVKIELVQDGRKWFVRAVCDSVEYVDGYGYYTDKELAEQRLDEMISAAQHALNEPTGKHVHRTIVVNTGSKTDE